MAEQVTLLERAEEKAILEQWIEEADEEIQKNEGELPQHLHELLMQALPNFKQRISACVARMKGWEADEKILSAEIDRLTQKRNVRRKRSEAFKRYVHLAMQIAREHRVDAGFYTVTRQGTKATVNVPDIITVEYARSLPAELVRETPATYSVKKDVALEWHNAKKQLPAGISITPGETIVIR